MTKNALKKKIMDYVEVYGYINKNACAAYIDNDDETQEYWEKHAERFFNDIKELVNVLSIEQSNKRPYSGHS